MELVRRYDKDRYLATLFVPEAKRASVFALYAFSLEVARIRELVSEPAPGEIRLQWWREVLERRRDDEGMAHPVAAGLMRTLERHELPASPLLNLIEARIFDLYDDPMPTLNDLEGYCGETCSVLFHLTATILAGDDVDRHVADAAGYAGVAYAMTGHFRMLGQYDAAGRSYIPRDLAAAHGIESPGPLSVAPREAVDRLLDSMREIAADHLAKARAALAAVPADLRTAFLPAAIVPLYLKVLARPGHDPFAPPAEVSQLRRQWALWRAARRGMI